MIETRGERRSYHEKMKPKKVWMIFWVVFGCAGMLGGISTAFDWPMLTVLAVIGIISALAFYFSCYRCPHCGRFLGRGYRDFCGYCEKNWTMNDGG